MRIPGLVLCLLVAVPLCAQDVERRWRLNTRLQGSFNETGQILKADSALGYAVNRHLEIYAGLPIYFVKNSTTSVEGGLGNAALGFVLDFNNPALHFNSSAVVTAPTGDRDKGFSTGHVTADWTTTFSRSFSTFVPYGSIGVANTVSDTAFFVRPFSSEGLVTHFEVGGIYGLNSLFSTGASFYGVRARGEQQIVVRELPGSGHSQGNQTRVIQDNANDDGASIWLSMHPRGRLDYILGYSRSSAYALDSIFFGVGFHVK
jgi:hypothetical protein